MISFGIYLKQPEHQQLIVDSGALPYLIDLLKKRNTASNSRALAGLIRRAADAITNLAHENSNIKTSVRFCIVHAFETYSTKILFIVSDVDCVFRLEGGIPPLVELLEFDDAKVQRAAAAALRTLAFKNDGNKKQVNDVA